MPVVQALQHASGDVNLQTADEDSVWQEYRAEDFGHSAEPAHASAQDDDAMLEAAIQASKADIHAQQTAFQQSAAGPNHSNSHRGGSAGSHSHGTNGHAPTEQPQNGGHRPWFPPVHADLVKATSDSSSAAQHIPHKATSVSKEMAEDHTYDDVMTFLLGP